MPFNYKQELGRYKRYYQNIGTAVRQPKTNAYTAAIFSFLAISLFGWYAIRPTLSTIFLLRREIADNALVSQQMEEKITKLIEAQAVYHNVKNKLPILEQALPEDPEAAPVVKQLRNLAIASQASISGIIVSTVPLVGSDTVAAESAKDQTPPQSKKSTKNPAMLGRKIASIPITVVLTGTYESLQTFLTGISEMRRIMTTETLSIIPEKEVETQSQPSGTILRLVLKLNAYYVTRQ